MSHMSLCDAWKCWCVQVLFSKQICRYWDFVINCFVKTKSMDVKCQWPFIWFCDVSHPKRKLQSQLHTAEQASSSADPVQIHILKGKRGLVLLFFRKVAHNYGISPACSPDPIHMEAKCSSDKGFRHGMTFPGSHFASKFK